MSSLTTQIAQLLKEHGLSDVLMELSDQCDESAHESLHPNICRDYERIAELLERASIVATKRIG